MNVAVNALTDEQWRIINYLNFKSTCIADQEAVGIALDFDKAVRHRDELLVLKEPKIVELQKVMPKTPTTVKKTKPKVTHKKDGTLSSHGTAWFALLKDNKLPMNFNGELQVITGYKEANPGSPLQVKDWLDSLGWVPTTFNFVRDKATGDERKIPQVRKDGELCSSVTRLIKKEPNVAVLEGLTIINHRIGAFQGFIDCSYVVPDETFNVPQKVYVKSEIGGLTNTLRFKHKKPIANMPKVGVAWGAEIRGCLIATEGEVFCGTDLSSLESTTKRHYMFSHDPDYVEVMSQEGYDEHLDLAIFAGATTLEDVEGYKVAKGKDKKGITLTNHEQHLYGTVSDIRQDYKVVNYSGIYGIGKAALSRSLGIAVKAAAKLISDYWDRNWAVKHIVEEQVVKKLKNGEMWLFNPVSEFWYSLRYEKDTFSTLNQGTGVYVFDKWLALSKQKGLTIAMQYHDEFLVRVKEGEEKNCEDEIKDAITKLNTLINLNVPIDAESAFGKNYADVH
tara:strand:- start:1203 stop:2720 length:1518 start_codon:yes stop_codon:yes gene_type:complete